MSEEWKIFEVHPATVSQAPGVIVGSDMSTTAQLDAAIRESV